MATVPLLDLCLKDCTLIRGRKFSVHIYLIFAWIVLGVCDRLLSSDAPYHSKSAYMLSLVRKLLI